MICAINHSAFKNNVTETSLIGLLSFLFTQLKEHHPVSYWHCKRTAKIAVAIFDIINESLASKDHIIEREYLFQAGLYHDVGKVIVPSACLNQAPATHMGRAVIYMHIDIVRFLGGTSCFSFVEKESALENIIANVIEQHHIRADGQGVYPKHLIKSIEDISIYSKIVALADAIDVMFFGRHYSKKKSLDEICQEITLCNGSHFFPEVANPLLKDFHLLIEWFNFHQTQFLATQILQKPLALATG